MSTSLAADSLERFTISPRRRRKDKVARGVVTAATALAIVPLVLIVYFLLSKGLGAWSWSFFSTDPTGCTFNLPGQTCGIGGVKSAILGSIEIVALASLIAIPIGIAIAIWLVEYGKNSRFAQLIRYFVDILTGVPSIVFGLFVFIALTLSGFAHGLAAWKGSVALALLMLPVVIRAAEVVLLLVPNSLREAALALGAPRWRVIFRIVVPTALPGIVTGVLLAVARAAGETAPLIFIVLPSNATTFNLGGPMNYLPIQIFEDVQSSNPTIVSRAWGAALALVTMILLLNLIARLISRRSRFA
jgi:phosphate transport system permease protein